MAGKSRARVYDPEVVLKALAGELAALAEAVHAVCAGGLLGAPTRLAGWSVRELVAHLAADAEWLPEHLDDPVVPARERLDLTAWVRGTASIAERLDAHAREQAAQGPFSGAPEEVVAAFDAAVGKLTGLLPEVDGSRVAGLSFGAISVADFLVTRLVEFLVHADDLAAAAPGVLPEPDAFPHDRQAVAAVTRVLADAFAAKAPGGAVELRVPPYAVVQCVPGPRHTRGTPPSVVETSPLTWIRLATGRTGWAEALDVADLTASGERSDLSSLLPVMG
jgi:uncharacterized protein (TIGR03083 family)